MINNGGGGTQPPIDPGYGGNGGGNQTPQEKEKISKKRDCDHIKKMKNDQNLINGLNGLKQHALNNNARTEKGMLYNTSDGLLNGSPSILEGNANDPSIQISFGPTTRINGISHTHYQGLNPIFSASDISAIGILGKGGVIADKGSFSSTLITNEGNVYMLKIHDIDMFNKWAITFSSDPLDVDNLLNIVSLSFPMGPELSQSKNEENLVKMIDALGTGLKLFRGNLDFSDWVGLKKNKENNKIEADPCD